MARKQFSKFLFWNVLSTSFCGYLGLMYVWLCVALIRRVYLCSSNKNDVNKTKLNKYMMLQYGAAVNCTAAVKAIRVFCHFLASRFSFHVHYCRCL